MQYPCRAPGVPDIFEAQKLGTYLFSFREVSGPPSQQQIRTESRHQASGSRREPCQLPVAEMNHGGTVPHAANHLASIDSLE